ncbi:Non-heme dioxygenase N-terminal domain containing protein [Parasponia andersonii]|uniref:Non-heme dioxygenase N-terminal domain containing protein n=1 Tax=Parasponia andersonii TaxID=3476 RepID=A0A2P5CT64_PARAD|nr:Non-heme dioxygenase N-terminal domain containing protein [Parasponia andersonii]
MESILLARDSTPISLSPDFILPEEKGPQLSRVSTLDSIPIIDLSVEHSNQDGHHFKRYLNLVKSMATGFFQIINHAVPQELCKRMLTSISDLFKLPPQERSKFFTTEYTKEAKIINDFLKSQNEEKVTMWSENFNYTWDPTEDFATLLPENPPHYRYK